MRIWSRTDTKSISETRRLAILEQWIEIWQRDSLFLVRIVTFFHREKDFIILGTELESVSETAARDIEELHDEVETLRDSNKKLFEMIKEIRNTSVINL